MKIDELAGKLNVVLSGSPGWPMQNTDLLALIEGMYHYTKRLEGRIAELEYPGVEYPPGKVKTDSAQQE